MEDDDSSKKAAGQSTRTVDALRGSDPFMTRGIDGALDDDALSSHSSRSDQSFEEAGLVSRLSDEEDREQRAARYDSVSGPRVKRSNSLEDEIGDDAPNDTYTSRDSLGDDTTTEAFFQDRSSTSQRQTVKTRERLAQQVWHIAREVSMHRVHSLRSAY